MAESNGTYRVQYAALPYRLRQDGEVQLRLVTSRETRRWVIPKGWPMKGTPPHKAAAREAYEEAGLLGSISSTPIGIYRYDKRLSLTRSVLCEVMVFPMKVKRYLKKWPERSQRVGFWFSIETAASVVQEPELASLILEFGAVMAERQAEKQAKAEAAARAKAEEDKPARAAPKKKAAPKKVAVKADADVAGMQMGKPSPNAPSKAREKSKGTNVERAAKLPVDPRPDSKARLDDAEPVEASPVRKRKVGDSAAADRSVKAKPIKRTKKSPTLHSDAPELESASGLDGAVEPGATDGPVPADTGPTLPGVPSPGKTKKTQVVQVAKQSAEVGTLKSTKRQKVAKPRKAKKSPTAASSGAANESDSAET